jgi:hypothetical protein
MRNYSSHRGLETEHKILKYQSSQVVCVYMDLVVNDGLMPIRRSIRLRLLLQLSLLRELTFGCPWLIK